jgi:acyl-coenzyme A thioesterase PaaI-like protein
LTVEFKVNLMAPAVGERFLARGAVVRPGRTLTVCEVEVVAERAGRSTPIARMLATMICIENTPDAAQSR